MRRPVVVLVLALSMVTGQAAADTAYVTDSITVAVFAAADLKGEPLERISSGALVDVLERGDGVTQVKTGAGKTGWLRTTFLTTNLPVSIRLEEADNRVSKLNTQLDTANDKLKASNDKLKAAKDQIKALEKDAGKAKDLSWMRAEMQKARKKAKELEAELAEQQARVAELEALPEPVDPAAAAQLELADLRVKNADLEQRLAATLLVNSEVDLMAETPLEPAAQPATWSTAMPWTIGGLLLGMLLGFGACYRWFEARIRGRYVRVY